MNTYRKATTEELWQSYQELESLRLVAKRHGYVSSSPVARRLIRAGHQLHPKHLTLDSRNIVPLDEVIEVFQQTKDYRETARLVSSTPAAVKERLGRAGIRKGSLT